ncbi:MAG: glycosyltransferase family 9 protein [Acidobacteria bacterium]|nr:glycosyltransferase family 9 protein [Acidobacteriota bacterium]
MTGPASEQHDSSAPESLRRRLEKVDRLLLIRLRSLGDSILTLPLLEALHDWRPGLKLDMLIESTFAPVFTRHPAVHEVWALEEGRGKVAAELSRAATLLRIFRRRYPAVLNLHGGPTSALFTAASGARLRIGQGTFRQARLYNVHLPPSSEIWGRSDLHTVEHQLSLIRWLGLPVPTAFRHGLRVGAEARSRIHARFQQAGIMPGSYFHLQPTATLNTKQWPEGRFARLGDMLTEETGLPVVFTAGSNETQTLVNVGQSARRKHYYWADLSLDELFALIEACRVFVANDSGPTHSAAALRKPVVAIWGSSNPAAWRPWGTEDYELVRSDLPCIPCPGYRCAVYGEPRCVLDITVEQVMDACRRLLGRRRQD